jgi:hypothetical protein
MITFGSRIDGIPCKIRVDVYEPMVPSRDYDEPDEPATFEYTVLDRYGYPAHWLQAKVTDAISQRIYEEFQFEAQDAYNSPCY